MNHNNLTPEQTEILMDTVKKNDSIIKQFINETTKEQEKNLKTILKMRENVETHPDYVKKDLIAQEKVKLISGYRIILFAYMMITFFSPFYKFGVAVIVSLLGIGLFVISVLPGLKEEKRLCETYNIQPSKFIAWLKSYRERMQKNVNR